jgi:Xaa-Pro dipeptidase
LPSKLILQEYKQHNLITAGDTCIVATDERSADPHYFPSQERNFPIAQNSVLLIDIFAKLNQANSVYADCTFMSWIGPAQVPAEVQKVWQVVKGARDLAVEFVQRNCARGNLRGFEIDRAVRKFITAQGYGPYFIHRTGHSLDQSDHGNGTNIDDFETHDTRKILPDTSFTIEPGIYLSRFGIRSEINVFIDSAGQSQVTTFKQDEMQII